MDRDEALRLLRGGEEGVAEWNRRRSEGEEIPDLGGADLRGADLIKTDLSGASLFETDLTGADLRGADLSGASLGGAILTRADLSGADLIRADLIAAKLSEADVSGADLNLVGLCEADLRGANLSGAILTRAELTRADFSGADLSWADLGGADLLGANLTGADLREAVFGEPADKHEVEAGQEEPNEGEQIPSLGKIRLKGARFRGATLIGADWSGLDLMETELQEADLTNADLSGVQSLLAERLAGANITNVKLSEGVHTFDSQLALIKDACSNARKIFLAMILASAYTVLTISSTDDGQLLTNSSSSPLPIIGAKIPIAGYYWISPAILLGFYLYFHLCMQRIWDRVARLPARLPDGRPIDGAVDPWLITGIIRSHFLQLKAEPMPFGRGQNVLSILLAWWLVPLTIAATAWDYLAIHEWVGTSIHIAIWAFAVSFGIASYMTARGTLRGAGLYKEPRIRLSREWVHRRLVPRLILVATTSAIAFGASWMAIEGQMLTANLEFAKLAGADLYRADLAGANLLKADLSRASLVGANLTGVFFFAANLSEASLTGANLRGANLSGANLSGADLLMANLAGAVGLKCARLTTASEWQSAYRDPELACGAEIPEPPKSETAE